MTAIEYLVDKLMKGEFINSPNELIEQAKEMEKQQIIDAWNEKAYDDGNTFVIDNKSAEQYYNETYGSKGSDETKTN